MLCQQVGGRPTGDIAQLVVSYKRNLSPWQMVDLDQWLLNKVSHQNGLFELNRGLFKNYTFKDSPWSGNGLQSSGHSRSWNVFFHPPYITGVIPFSLPVLWTEQISYHTCKNSCQQLNVSHIGRQAIVLLIHCSVQLSKSEESLSYYTLPLL